MADTVKSKVSVARELAAKVRECYLALLEAGFNEEQSQDMTFDLYVLVSNEEDYQAGLTMEQIVAVAEARFGHPDFREFPDGWEGDGEILTVDGKEVYFYTLAEAAEMKWSTSEDNSEGCGNPSCPGCGLNGFMARLKKGESIKALVAEFADHINPEIVAKVAEADEYKVHVHETPFGLGISIGKDQEGEGESFQDFLNSMPAELKEFLGEPPAEVKDFYESIQKGRNAGIPGLLGVLLKAVTSKSGKGTSDSVATPAPPGDSTVAPSAPTSSDYFVDEAASLGAETPAAPPAPKLSEAEQWGLTHLQLQGTVNDLAAKMGRAYAALQEHVQARPMIQHQEPTN